MMLPFDLLTQTYVKPKVFLCETDKTKICPLDPINFNGSFKFNSISELSFEIPRVYNDIITGDIKVNPFYDKVEALRLVDVDGFGYFEIQGPELVGDGIKEVKNITANSYEYTLSTKYLEHFYVNQGTVDSLEVLNAADPNKISPIILYNPNNPKLSLLHLILEKTYGWSIGHVDASLQTLSRQFKIDRESVYDFIMNEICKQFNCYAVFDTINNTINLYAESLTARFIGDGTTNTFIISPPFSEIGTVSIDGYKTTRWDYDSKTGILILEDVPYAQAHIEVVDGALTEWETDVFVTFDNLSQEVKINYDADAIKTVLTVTYGDDIDIRESNLGLPYLTDLSYYYTIDWMGQELYDVYTAYLQQFNLSQSTYTENSMRMLELAHKIDFEENRLSLDYALVKSVNETTVGTYYVRRGDAPDYYFVEVSLPSEYNVNTDYYSELITNLQDGSDGNVAALYDVLKDYFYIYFKQEIAPDPEIELESLEDVLTRMSELSSRFQFMIQYTIDYLVNSLRNATNDTDRENAMKNFFGEMWNQIGKIPLQSLYYEPYKKVQIANMEAGWSQKDNENYGYYYPVVILLESIEAAITKRDTKINGYQNQYNQIQNTNINISNELIMKVFFTKYFNEKYPDSLFIANQHCEQALVRLSAFLREDELHLEDIVETDLDTLADSFKLKQDAMESGRIELSKLCQPQLQFSMSMANIYALPEFKPIISQFQLGKVIKVGLRKDYIKQSRLLEVDINFDDFSDFSCEFGELTSLRKQSDIHADLLSKAVSAGKSVATNSSYWSKGADTATSIDLRLQEGLLNSIEALKATDGTQDVTIDKYGVHLQKIVDPNTQEKDPKQAWLLNNQILFTDDGFKSCKAALGEFIVDGVVNYGLLAQAVIAGYIEGSIIRGGVIQIGERGDGTYNFEVDSNGYITMIGGKGISSNGEVVDLDAYNTTIDIAADNAVLRPGMQSVKLTCSIYSYDVDVTDNYDQSAYHWVRISGNDEADAAWNAEKEKVVCGDTLIITSNDLTSNITFFQCRVDLISGNIKTSNSIAITTSDSGVNIFTSKPSSPMADGYCYHVGDLWVVSNDYQPSGYQQHTILVCIKDNTLYSDENWVESADYSTAFNNLNNRTTKLEQHVIIEDDGLHLRAPSNNDITFESLLTASELAFGTNSESGFNKIVWLGNDDMNARNVTVENYINVKAKDNNQPYIKLGNFSFQIETNGSLSII